MNMKKILLALGIGAGVGAAYYFAKKKLDEMQEENEMYYDMYAAHPYTPGPAGPAKRPAAAAAEPPASAELTAEEEDTEPPSVAGKDLKEEPAAGPQETPAPEPATVPEPAAGPEHEREGASAEDGEKDDTPKKKPPKTKF